jgi:hypothetical protein
VEKKIINRENILQHLLEYELWLSGHKLVNMIETPNYRFDFTVTREQRESFTWYAILLLKKIFHFNKKKAISTFEWYLKNVSLRIKED